MHRLPVLLAPILPLVLAACGGGGSDKQASSSSACPSGAVVVHMKNLKFNPDKASAKVGQEVCWVNDEDIQHDAVDEESDRFASELFDKGKTFTWKADKAGTVNYVCTVHPGMRGELDVN